MSCQEVMELVQRYLDRDLNETELEGLMLHVGQCPECASLLERFQRLSEDLEALPAVAPPISLVDAILPKLDEIDRLAAEESHRPEAASMETGEADRIVRPVGRRRLREQISFRMLGGVVAAGIVIGLFIMNHPPKAFDMHSAGESTEMSTASSADSATADSGASSSARKQAAAPSADGKASFDTFSARNDAADSAKEQAPVSGDSVNGGSKPDANAADSHGSSASSGSMPSGETNNAMQLKSKDQYGASETNPKTADQASPGAGSAPASGGTGSSDEQPTMQPKSNVMGLAPAAGDRNGSAPDEATPPANGDEQMSLMAAPPSEPSYPSPDKAYTAFVQTAEDGRMQIVIRDADQKVVFQSQLYQVDQIADVTWSADDRWLEYDLATGESSSHVKVDVQNKTESQQ